MSDDRIPSQIPSHSTPPPSERGSWLPDKKAVAGGIAGLAVAGLKFTLTGEVSFEEVQAYLAAVTAFYLIPNW